MVKEALETLRSVHDKECELYRSKPSIHPDIGAEYRLFFDKKVRSILALGGDPTQYNMAEEWYLFWNKRMEEKFLESWRLKREKCIALLDAHQKPSSPQPSARIHRSHSSSSSVSSSSSSSSSISSLFSSSSSSSISSVQQRKRSKKRRKNRFTKCSKRKRRKHESKTSSCETNPRGKRAKRSSSFSDGYEERYPKEYLKTILPENGDSEEDRKVKDSPKRKVPDMSREAKKKKWVKKPFQQKPCKPPYVEQPSREGQSQSAVKSSKKINREPPSPPQISRMRQQELDGQYKKWCLPSPPNQSTIHGEPQQHTSKHNIIDPIFMDEHPPNFTIQTEEVELEELEQHKDKSHHIVQDQWLHLSSKKCITVSKESPEAVVSEVQGKQDTWKRSDSNMKEEDLKNTTCQPERYKEYSERAKAYALFARSQEGQSYQGILKLKTMQPTSKMTINAVSSQHHLNQTEGKLEEDHSVLSDNQNRTESLTQIFQSFAAKMLNNPSTVESTTPGHKDEVSSTTSSNENTKIDVVDVLEVLIHLEDKIGAICAPLKQILVEAKVLQSNGTDPMIIVNDKDNKFLLHLIQEKLQSLLKDSQISIIKKVIVEEAKQRLSALLEYMEPHKLLGDLSLTQVVSHCLNMDVTATLTYICEVLQAQGHTHVPQEQLVNLYKSVEAEKLILKKSCHDNRTSTITNWRDNSEFSCLQLLGNSVNPPHRSLFKVAFVGHEQMPTHFALDGCEIKIYRSPGGTARNFLSDPRMNRVLHWSHDLTILFLGSNDIHQNCEAIFITDKITQVAELIKQTCNSKTAITLIEPRKIQNSNWVSQEFYDMVSKAINENLKKDMKEQFFINLTTTLQKEKKHLNDEWKALMGQKFSDIILKFKQLHEVIKSVIGSEGKP